MKGDDEKPTSRVRRGLDVITAIVMLAVAVLMFVIAIRQWRTPAPTAKIQANTEAPLPADPISVARSTAMGSSAASVAIIEWSDFQCPYCGRFSRDILPELKRKYIDDGRVRLFLFQHPLPMHPFAEKAAEADLCAARQGKAWEMHDLLFQDQTNLDIPSINARADRLGLDRHQFDQCLAGGTAERVKSDTAAATALHLTGTPAFFIGTVRADGQVKVTKRLNGALPLAEFAKILDPLLVSARAGK